MTGIDVTKDGEFQSVVMDCYQEALQNSVNLNIFIKTPKRDRKGRINRYAKPFREEFLRLFQMTKNIKTITRFNDEINNINNWFEIMPDFINEQKLIRYYTIGINLFERWNKLLNEQGIISYG